MTSANIPELDRKGLREFGLTTGVILAILFGALFPWFLDAKYPMWPWIILVILATLAMIAPALLRPIYRVWMRFGLLMSKFMTPMVLGVVFFLLVFPMGLIMRVLGKDPMARKLHDTVASYRVESHKAPRENMERPF